MLRRALSIASMLVLSGCSALPKADGQGYLEVETLGSLSSEIGESSALALDGHRVWTLNDSGNGPWLYRLGLGGQIERRVRLAGTTNIDWESMAADEDRLFVADCGNNSGRRDWLQLHSVGWDQLREAQDGAEVEAQTIAFRLADPAPVSGPQAHDNDCEAIASVEGEVWLLTKGWASSASRLYRLDISRDQQSIEAVATWPVKGLVTGMDYSPQRKELVVLGYTLGRLHSDTFIWRVPVSGHEPDWSGASRYILWPSGQWEAVVWQGDELLLTRENSLLGEARLGRVRIE
ncbi:hypothetical protein GCM10011352_15860 [Marinobacterium zhoushanense]|uniref:Uncharacterized protein n=1 Tax=Marinobacterium zhoushanense TaxID=1679163 RepID=A0ABQ1KBC1_9GAMM|nr:hypothetical protein [Marinobacterium zhoushanense]GGB90657.1 hypothetical protein GCM10011352_15860 [Marinobacterium zhoushanense]